MPGLGWGREGPFTCCAERMKEAGGGRREELRGRLRGRPHLLLLGTCTYGCPQHLRPVDAAPWTKWPALGHTGHSRTRAAPGGLSVNPCLFFPVTRTGVAWVCPTSRKPSPVPGGHTGSSPLSSNCRVFGAAPEGPSSRPRVSQETGPPDRRLCQPMLPTSLPPRPSQGPVVFTTDQMGTAPSCPAQSRHFLTVRRVARA